ncbi:hypothetical protein Pla100_45940 [Neorhodopirellula pilleata]|uniref:Uncharacterized protein n=2 Tax=Neorhodopirellula pilleata TaxID=2714738 RepID=A0A5C5ZZK1_9BACT|nr:hypothetical protein Pla100_45940 [Neorhodopirellula pilleata]
MVQIVAPEPTPPALIAGDEDVDSQEMTQGDLSSVHEEPHAGLPPIPPPFPGNVSELQSGQPPIAPETIADNSNDSPQEVPWSSTPQQNSRRWLLIAATSLGAVLTCGLLAFSMWGSPDRLADDTTPTVPNDAALSDAIQPDSIQPDVEQSPALDAADPEVGSSTKTENPQGQTDGQPATDTTMSQPKTETGPMIPAGLLPVDPLRGESTDAGKTPGESSTVVRNQEPDLPTDPLIGLPPELEAFTRLLDMPGGAPDAPPVEPVNANVAELRVEEAADAMIDPMLLATPPPKVNINNALKLRVALQTDGYPLSDFMLLASELTQVPIQIDWVTLDLAQWSITQLVKDEAPGWKPVDQRLKEVAKSTGLVIEPSPDQLLVTLELEPYKAKLASIISTDDFGDEQVSADEVVSSFLKATQWNEREKVGLSALVADGLRIARDIPPKINATARQRWMVEAICLKSPTPEGQIPKEEFQPRWPLIKGGESGMQLDTAITMAGFLRHTARLNQATALVNWQDARDRRLSPGQLVMPYAGDPAGTMLRKTLQPLGLSCRDAGQSVWWVGTDATYDRMPLLVVGDSLGPQRQAVLDRIRLAAVQGGTEILLQHDPVSDRYLSLMPRFLYRQLPKILQPFQ